MSDPKVADKVKPLTFGWLVLDAGGVPVPKSFRWTDEACKKAFLDGDSLDLWSTYLSMGYRCVKVTVTEGWQ